MKQRFRKKGDIATRAIAGETILVPVSAHVAQLNFIYILNEVGSLVWQLLDGRTELDQIAEAISREYEVAAQEATKDLTELVASLEAAGLVQLCRESEH